MKVSKNAYYTWLRVKDSRVEKTKLIYLKTRIEVIFNKNRQVYGSLRIQKALEREVCFTSEPTLPY